MTKPKREAAAKPRRARPPAPPAADHVVADAYHEIAVGDGVIRVEEGHVAITTAEGVTAMPPERFAEAQSSKTEA